MSLVQSTDGTPADYLEIAAAVSNHGECVTDDLRNL